MTAKKTLAVFMLAPLMLLGFTACGGTKYRIDYRGQKDSYTNARDSYSAGSKVVLYYDLIDTDTDYSFFIDGKELSCKYKEGKGFVISFTMPDHDTVLECKSVRSMVRDADTEGEMLINYFATTVGTEGEGEAYELILYSGAGDKVRLSVSRVVEGETEEEREYLIPREAADRCLKIARENDLAGWNGLNDADSLDGALTVVRYKDGDSYVRASTEKMPENGEKILNSIRETIEEYITY
ncbi:MAG: hypothetical protein IKH65_07210 [Clostridia bacterium]|nr:hypothetical protein [Clostridia bacterium]